MYLVHEPMSVAISGSATCLPGTLPRLWALDALRPSCTQHRCGRAVRTAFAFERFEDIGAPSSWRLLVLLFGRARIPAEFVAASSDRFTAHGGLKPTPQSRFKASHLFSSMNECALIYHICVRFCFPRSDRETT